MASDVDAIWAEACPAPLGPWDDLWALSRAGVSTPHLQGIGALNIKVGNPWAPNANGDRAILVPACDAAESEIVDLVAFRTEAPRAYWALTGRAPMLGYEALAYAEHYSEPLMVFESPLEWLKGERDGIVVLDWKHYWPLLLSGIPALRCATRSFGKRLSETLKRPFEIPKVQVAT